MGGCSAESGDLVSKLKELQETLYGDPREWSGGIWPCNGLRRLGISEGVQGTSIAGGVERPRKSKPLYKSCKYTFSYKRITKDA
ncbi:hypothetical protein PHAGE_BARTON_57 [Acinetobacter phage Barton]|nr:hypothetical protein PHAGE_BARTON_57 [Acinetobacter phage Barton]